TNPLILVTDNGAAMRPVAEAPWFQKRPWLKHSRTRHKAPQTSGVIERWSESLTYERHYRHGIDGDDDLASRVETCRHGYNRIRPHENINWQRHHDRYLTTPKPSAPTTPETEQES